jgi:uncharacterized protein (DUF2235 family)
MPRRIVLLSDGTGNSSAKVWRTNVWRMFCALDLTSNDQVACYDDGVGTSSFKPLAILGGAFGIGLRRNVISLYKFACRNYRSTDDEIFGFGFSRGAFTIRVAIGLILDQGLIHATDMSESELDREARRAYRVYHKKHFHTNWGLIAKAVRNRFGKTPITSTTLPAGPKIRFLGLWDTVAAYGLPIDEMTKGVSQWIWPLEIPSHTLNPKVKRACHALSLDDERTTFHPVLWDEGSPNPLTGEPRLTKDERITQIWFAGVHANVGGGYPDDSLAQIPLYWIMEEARACGLTFKPANPEAVAETKAAQDKDGRLYDSRSGSASYYRYGPRRLARLCNEIFSRTMNDKVTVAIPKIHESVLRRIQNQAHVYAPIGIPHAYDVVRTEPDAQGSGATFKIESLPTRLPSDPSHVYELSGDAQARVIAEREKIWPLVWLRGLLYLLTLLATLFFLLFPLTGRDDPLGERINSLKWLSDLIRGVGGFLPGWASNWVVGYAQYPWTFLIVVVALGSLLVSGNKIAARISDRMTALWRRSFDHEERAPETPPSKTPAGREQILFVLRSGWKDYVGPALSALVIAYLGLAVANRALFTVADDAGYVCKPTKDLVYVPDAGALIAFPPSDLCFSTGYRIGRLNRYLIWTNPDVASLNRDYPGHTTDRTKCDANASAPLVNGDVVADARGYSTFRNVNGVELTWVQTVKHVLFTPLRRYYFQPWFQPVARYGSVGDEVDFLEPDPDSRVKRISEYVTPKVGGELFFYLNDAVLALPRSYQWLYQDNQGCMAFFIKPSK